MLAIALLGVILVKPPVDTTRIPLCAGLTVVTAIDEPKGDYESVKRVTRVTPKTIEIAVNGDRPMGSTVRRIAVARTDLREDLKNATFYLHHWKLGIEGQTDSIAGDAYNKDLSERRAAAVKDALTGRYQVAADATADRRVWRVAPKRSQ